MEVTVDPAELNAVAERVVRAGSGLAVVVAVARAGPPPTPPVVALAVAAWASYVDALARAAEELGRGVTTAASSYVEVDAAAAERLRRAGSAP